MHTIHEIEGFKTLALPREYWDRQDEWFLRFSLNWNVSVCEMFGDSFTPLSEAAIMDKLKNPIGCQKIEELARGKKEVAIIVDDITRPTRASLMAEIILSELLKAGVDQNNIRFIIATGCHGAHGQDDFRKKLGTKVVENYRVYNHNCYENCVYVGTTRRGIDLHVNAELMKCDLKIGIGCILPHLYAGYSGGGKIILPGLCHIDTAHRFHSSFRPDQKGISCRVNPLCNDIEDAVNLVGLDFKADILVNTHGEVIDFYAGKPNEVYQSGSKAAEKIYKSKCGGNKDIVVTNAYLKANEGDIAMLLGLKFLKPANGICVLVMSAPRGQMTHYLMRAFGKFVGGRQWVTRLTLPRDTTFIVLSEYKDLNSFDALAAESNIIWMKSWEEVQCHLETHYPGSCDVAVIPDGTIQYA